MRKNKSLATVLLVLFVIAAIPTQAFAAEPRTEAVEGHTHQWYFDHYDTLYIPIDGEDHLRVRYPVYYCSVSGCNEVDVSAGIEATLPHSMTSYSYTGSNYHSGKYHYVRYERSCVQCSYSDGYWDHYLCPGNGHCILPQSVFPILKDK